MRKFINFLIFLLVVLLLIGYTQGTDFRDYNNLPANLYKNVKTVYEKSISAIESILVSGELPDLDKSRIQEALSTGAGINKLLDKGMGSVQTLTGMPEYKYTANNIEEYKTVVFGALNTFEDSVTVRINNYNPDIHSIGAVNEVIYDNFDIDYGIESIGATIYSGRSYHVMKITFDYAFNRDTMLSMKAASDAKAAQITSEIIKPGMSELQKERAIHDYIVKLSAHDYDNLTKGTLPEEVYTMYGVLINRKAVCEGYAKAMFKLLNLAGIENMVVVGEADGVPHAWNLVKINGSWTHLDATWDDPVTRTNKGILSHKYFNISDEQISKDHTWDKSKYPKGVSMP